MSEHLELALRATYEKITREELIELAIILTIENLHIAGRKRLKNSKEEKNE